MTQALRSIKGQRLQWSLKTTALPNEKVRESGLAYVNDRRGNALYSIEFSLNTSCCLGIYITNLERLNTVSNC